MARRNPRPIPARRTDERAYEAALRRAYFAPFVRRLQARLANATGTTDVYRALDAEVEALQARPRNGVPVELIEEQIRRLDGYHREKLFRTFRAALGVDIRMFLTRPAIAAFMTAKISENVSLIRTIPPRFHEGLKRRVAEEEFREAPFDQARLRVMLRREYQSSGYNLRRLTRDQTQKTIAGLTETRHQQLAITRYIWRTSQDERVRPSHTANNGQTFEWSQPPAGTGHPGNDVQCRCTAEPVILPSQAAFWGATEGPTSITGVGLAA